MFLSYYIVIIKTFILHKAVKSQNFIVNFFFDKTSYPGRFSVMECSSFTDLLFYNSSNVTV